MDKITNVKNCLSYCKRNHVGAPPTLANDALTVIEELEKEIYRLNGKENGIQSKIKRAVENYSEYKGCRPSNIVLNRRAMDELKNEIGRSTLVGWTYPPAGRMSYDGMPIRVIDDEKEDPNIYLSDCWVVFSAK